MFKTGRSVGSEMGDWADVPISVKECNTSYLPAKRIEQMEYAALSLHAFLQNL